MNTQKTIWTIGEILQWTKQYFGGKGVENPRLDAEVLLSHILHQDRLYLYVHFDQPLQPEELAAFRQCVKKRAARIPVAYITGTKEFMGLAFTVSPSVLIPRPETELLVEQALVRMAPLTAPAILDLGTGSGAIAVSVLKNLPQAQGVAVDISPEALAIAEKNAWQLGVADRLTLAQGDLFAPVAASRFDAILSNPPYIPCADLKTLQPEVCREPVFALDGGRDGLDFYRRIIAQGSAYLKPDGFIAFEIGMGQLPGIKGIVEPSRFVISEVQKDYAGIERVVTLTLRR